MSRQAKQMWEALSRTGLIEGAVPETGKLESPWYVKVLLAFSGWLAAVFLLLFIGTVFGFLFRNHTAVFIVGSIMIGGAFAILRIPKNEFIEHLGIAASLAGQALVVFAIFQISNRNEKFTWILVTLLQVSLAGIMPNFVHRVFSTFFAAFAFSMTLTIMGWHYVVDGTVMLLAAICWLNEFHYPQYMRKIRAFGYGLVLALIQLKGTALFGYRTMGWRLSPNQSEVWARAWLGELLIGAVTLYVVWRLLKRYNQAIGTRLSIATLLGNFTFMCRIHGGSGYNCGYSDIGAGFLWC